MGSNKENLKSMPDYIPGEELLWDALVAEESRRTEVAHARFETAAKRINRLNARKKKRQNILKAGAVAVAILITSTIIAMFMPIQVAEADTIWDRFVGFVQGVFRIETSRNDVGGGVINDEKVYMNVNDVIADGYNIYYPSYIPEDYSLKSIDVSRSENFTRVTVTFSNGTDILYSMQGFGTELQKLTLPQTDSDSTSLRWNELEGEYWFDEDMYTFVVTDDAIPSYLFVYGAIEEDVFLQFLHSFSLQ